MGQEASTPAAASTPPAATPPTVTPPASTPPAPASTPAVSGPAVSTTPAGPANPPMPSVKDMYDTTGRLLSDEDQLLYIFDLTDLAKKYSHPIGNFGAADHTIIKNTNKSGMTPLSSPPNEPAEVPSQRRKRQRMNEYQRKRFRRFTTAELTELDAIEALDQNEYNDELNSPIHPIYQRDQWFLETHLETHEAAIPILGDFEGLWTADNDVVWDLLTPCLRLASKLLCEQQQYTWLHTLLKGKLYKLKGVPIKRKMLGIEPTAEDVRRNDLQEVQDIFRQDIPGRIKFRMTSGYLDDDGLPEEKLIRKGATMDDKFQREDIATVTLSVEILEPLLRKDLTDAEKLASQIHVAKTVLHETAHAVWKVHSRKRVKNSKKSEYAEPYYDKEPLSELGFSFTKSMFGYEPTQMNTQSFYKGGPGLPHIGFYACNWFIHTNSTYKTSKAPPRPNMIKPIAPPKVDPYRVRDSWPVPTSWSANMFKNDWWTVGVGKHDDTYFHMGPLTSGRRLFDLENKAPPLPEASATGYLSHEGPGYREDLATMPSMTRAEYNKVVREQKRIKQAGSVLDAITIPKNKRRRLSNSTTPDSSPGSSTGAGGDTDPGPDGDPDSDNGNNSPAETPPQVTYTCNRYDEIKDYLLRNRKAKRLALDTMTILSEPVFYRYIRDRGGINLTALEFRNFLAVAHQKMELFIWEPFPGRGIVYRRNQGWPPPPSDDGFSSPSTSDDGSRTPPEPNPLGFDLEIVMGDEGRPAVPFQHQIPDTVLQDHITGAWNTITQGMAGIAAKEEELGHQGKLYQDYGENRDVSMKEFYRAMRRIDKYTWKIGMDDFEDLVNEVINAGSSNLAHGPKGIVRFIYPIAPHHRAKAPQWNQDRMADLERRAQEISPVLNNNALGFSRSSDTEISLNFSETSGNESL